MVWRHHNKINIKNIRMFLQLCQAFNIFVSTQIEENDYFYDKYTFMVTSYK